MKRSDQLTEVRTVRLARSDVRRLESLAKRFDLKPMAIMRRVLRLGFDRAESSGAAALFQARDEE
jgi:hypothetical protein